jgi:hypothetical protein
MLGFFKTENSYPITCKELLLDRNRFTMKGLKGRIQAALQGIL